MDPFFIYLSESYKALDNIIPLTTNQILFEAEDNEKVAKIANDNAANKEKSESMFSKAIASLKALINKIIDSIKNFMAYMGLSKDQKALYKEFREKVKNNPEFRNKKVTVKVYEGIQEAYSTAIKNAENAYKNIKDNEADARKEQVAKALDNAKDNVKYVTKSVSLGALCKMIDDNEAFARNLESAIMMDRMTVNKLEETYGKKGMKKIDDHIYVKTHKLGLFKVGLKAIIIKARQKEVEYVGDSLKELTKDIPRLLRAGKAIDRDKTDAITNTVKDVVGDSVIQGAKGPVGKTVKKQVTTKGPIGYVRRKYHEKFDKEKPTVADNIEDARSYLRLRRESVEDIPFHEYYISDYYSESLKEVDPKTKKAVAGAALGIAAIGGAIAIGRKISANHKKKLNAMFRLYEQNHPDVIPANTLSSGVYSEDEAIEMHLFIRHSSSGRTSRYTIFMDDDNRPFMYIVKSFEKIGSTSFYGSNTSLSIDSNLVDAKYDLMLSSPLAKRHATYYRAYMAFKIGIGHQALNRFIATMKTELKKAQNSVKESAYDMILEDTEFDGFEEYLESCDNSLFFDEFYKEANELF